MFDYIHISLVHPVFSQVLVPLASSKLPVRGSHSALTIAVHPAVKRAALFMHNQNPTTLAPNNYINRYNVFIFYYSFEDGRAGVAW